MVSFLIDSWFCTLFPPFVLPPVRIRAPFGFAFMALCALSSLAAEIPLHRVGGTIRPCENCLIYIDSTRTLSAEGALARVLEFSPNHQPSPNFGFSNQVYFAAFRLVSEQPANVILLVDYAPLDHVDLFIPESRVKSSSGDQIPFSRRPVRHRSHAFPIQLEPGRPLTVLLRFESEGTLEFPIRVLPERDFRDQAHDEQLGLGLYYGILLVLIIYNLILFFTVKDISYLYYLLYAAGYGFIQLLLNGLAFEYIWPNWPAWNNRALPFFIGWAFFFGILFARDFLHSRRFAPGLDRFLNVLMILLFFQMPLAFVLEYNTSIRSSAFLVILFAVSVFVTAILCVMRGNRPARYFLFAWLSLLVGVSIYSLKGLGILPANFATEYILQIGSAIEMSLLSLGLGDRIRVIEQEEQTSRLHAARLEIELLKRNITPHFLLNSLNAASIWLEENPREARTLLEALSDEMRILLDVSARTWIPISTEIELCRAHLSVMSLREDKKFSLDVQGITGEELIPPLILHTAVENGLTHGFEKASGGSFKIYKQTAGGSAVYFIENDGNPLAAGESRARPADVSRGSGLRYVRTRLEESSPGSWSLEHGPIEGGYRTRIEFSPPPGVVRHASLDSRLKTEDG